MLGHAMNELTILLCALPLGFLIFPVGPKSRQILKILTVGIAATFFFEELWKAREATSVIIPPIILCLTVALEIFFIKKIEYLSLAAALFYAQGLLTENLLSVVLLIN